MPEYKGNAIYDYIMANNLDYFFCVENEWILLYGDEKSMPRLVVYASKVSDINSAFSIAEKNGGNKSYGIAKYLKLPFIIVRFMVKSVYVRVWQQDATWQVMTYDQLRDLFEYYGVVRPGTPKKKVNQYVSSPYHEWQRDNMGSITVTDFDLVKYRNARVEEIIELKRSHENIKTWLPYRRDYPNFALLINAIVLSGKHIPFTLFYNLLEDGPKGKRIDDISEIKVFDFEVPEKPINCHLIKYGLRGYYALADLLD